MERWCFCVALAVFLGLATVRLHVKTLRAGYESGELSVREDRLRRRIKVAEVRLARLSSPEALAEAIGKLDSGAEGDLVAVAKGASRRAR